MSDVNVKMPEAGEYWESSGGARVRIVGKGLREFDYVCLYNNGQSIVIEWKITGYNWRHLPGCDSFSWEQPKLFPKPLRDILRKFPIGFDSHPFHRESPAKSPQDQVSDLVGELEQKMVDNAESVLKKLEADVASGNSFPQYWTALAGDAAYVKRTSQDAYVLVRKDGTESPVRPWSTNANYRRLLTEAEAMALLEKPVAAEPIAAATAEDSDPWVIQDRESVRTWADEIRWSIWPAGYWEKATHHVENFWHGHMAVCAVLSVRCRQSNIPELNQRVLYREPRPFEELPSISAYDDVCVNLRVPESGDEVTDDLIRAAVRRDIAVAFISGSLAFSPIGIGRSDWQESNQLADLPKAAVAFADDMLKQLGFEE